MAMKLGYLKLYASMPVSTTVLVLLHACMVEYYVSSSLTVSSCCSRCAINYMMQPQELMQFVNGSYSAGHIILKEALH
jgi:hypothetical protein